MPETSTRVCAAHGVETRLQCAECGDPVCMRCYVRTEVGLKCPKCAALPETALPRPQRSRGLIGVGAGVVIVVVVALIVILRAASGSSPTASPPPAPVGHWQATATLSDVRGGNGTAVLLNDGRVLVVGGGIGAVAINGSEVYDPNAKAWTVSGNLAQARRSNATVVLKDGRVLTAGGVDRSRNVVLASAEIWTATTGTWTPAASMHTARFNLILVPLPSGKVLAAGGTDSTGSALSSAEIYDPTANTWSAAGNMSTSRSDASAVALADGRVLIAGGFSSSGSGQTALSSAELFDPAANIFSNANPMFQARFDFTLTALTNGKVLAAGGTTGSDALNEAELFDPSSGSWSGTGAMIQPRHYASASLLGDGTVLVAGGEFADSGSQSTLQSAEIFDSKTGHWRPTTDMSCPRFEQSQVTLQNGSALVVAGDYASPGQQPRAQNCAEIFTR